MKKILEGVGKFLEKIDHYRDQFLFLFIKPYWPRRITPNQITLIRIIIGIILFVMLFFLGVNSKVSIVVLFCIGVLTDLFDGSVARGLNKVTELGAMLDHLADWILILPIAIYSLYNFDKWLLLCLLLAEITNIATLVFTKAMNMETKSNIYGKTRMVLFCIVFAAVLIVWPQNPPEFFIDLVWVSLIFTLLSIFVKILDLYKLGMIKNKTLNKELSKYIEK